jgi:hypothetical protein
MENSALKDFYALNKKLKKTIIDGDKNTLYGNITYEGTEALIEHFKEYFNEDTVFYDLGCGPGHMPVHISVATNAKKCVGIEMIKDRYYVGVKHYHTVPENRAQLINGDFFMHDWSDATVVYIDNTVLTLDLMRRFWERVPKGCLVIMCKSYRDAKSVVGLKLTRSYSKMHPYFAIK